NFVSLDKSVPARLALLQQARQFATVGCDLALEELQALKPSWCHVDVQRRSWRQLCNRGWIWIYAHKVCFSVPSWTLAHYIASHRDRTRKLKEPSRLRQRGRRQRFAVTDGWWRSAPRLSLVRRLRHRHGRRWRRSRHRRNHGLRWSRHGHNHGRRPDL